MYDMLLKNGILLDPTAGVYTSGSLAITNRRIVESGNIENAAARQVVDVGGSFITAGFIDYHAHVFSGACDFAVPVEAMAIPNGVTMVVDAGSAGSTGFEACYKTTVANACIPVKAMLSVCSIGQPSHSYMENPDPDLFNQDRIAWLCDKYRDCIVALKLRQSMEIVGALGLEPLKASLRIAEKVGLRLVVHISNSPGDVEDTLELLRPGDVFCHMYHQKGKTILDEEGRILPAVIEARKRGVLFDMAHGSMQFSGAVAKAAIDQGVLPDIVSSDLSSLSFYKSPTYSFPFIMSELLNLGMPLEQIIVGCTSTPARLLGLPGHNFFAPGKPANLTVFRVVDRDVRYRDRYGNDYEGVRLIKPEMTIVNGVPLYRQYDIFDEL